MDSPTHTLAWGRNLASLLGSAIDWMSVGAGFRCRLLSAIGAIPAAALEHDADGLKPPMDVTFTFRTARQRPGGKTLQAIKLDAALVAPICIHRHRTTLPQTLGVSETLKVCMPYFLASTLMTLGRAASDLGNVIVSTPFSNVASTLSASTGTLMVNARLNLP